jgi:DNA-binding transcriptional LysR family regulator
MRIEQLQAFVAIADTGSFQQAARRCNCTQSTISRQIQALEADLEITLFHRHHQAKLTVGGERFLPHARKICGEWAQSQKSLEDLRTGKQPELCVAAIHSVCAYLLPPVLQNFCDRYPQIALRVTALGSDRALKVLKDGLVDLAIVMDNRLFTASPEMVVEHLYTEPIQVLMASEHPLSSYQSVPWAELVNYPQTIFKDGYGMQRLLQTEFSKQSRRISIMLELNTLDSFRGVVRQGKSIALLPQSALAEIDRDPTLTVRALDPIPDSGKELTRNVMMVTTEDRLLIPPIKYFFDLVKNKFQIL